MNAPILLDTGPSRKSLHRLDSFLFCAKYYGFAYLSGIVLPPAEPLIRGIFAHVGGAHLEARRWAVQNNLSPDMFYEPLTAIDLVAERERPKWGILADTERKSARSAIQAYMETVDPRATHRVMHVETEFAFQVQGPKTGRIWEYTQKPDLIDEENGYIFIDDWKSSMKPGEVTFSRYSPSIQFLAFQWWGPKMFGRRFGGARIKMLGLREPHQFATMPVEPAPQLIRQFPELIEDCELEIERLAAEGRPWERYRPAANERVCMTSYGRCNAWVPCRLGAANYTPSGPDLIQFNIPTGAGKNGLVIAKPRTA